METYRANGKLLLSGEYAVLDGALALALPVNLGQTLSVEYEDSSHKNELYWEALLHDGSLWFSARFELNPLKLVESTDKKLGDSLFNILRVAENLNPDFFKNKNQNIKITTRLEFPKNWGLGSSSTLISLLSQLLQIDAFELNKLTFNTSGFDVACATTDSPIFYQLLSEGRRIEPVDFRPDFLDRLYFVYLNKKQDTQKDVSKNYKDIPRDLDWINGISAITYNMQQSKRLAEFELLMNLHEEAISSKLGFTKVRDLYFSDYDGGIKSLGAWGGDFIMVTKREGFEDYFKSKGFNVILLAKDLGIFS